MKKLITDQSRAMTATAIVKGVLGMLTIGIVIFSFVFFKNRRGEVAMLVLPHTHSHQVHS